MTSISLPAGNAPDVRAARVEFAVPASDRAAAPESTLAFDVTPRERASLVSDVLTAHNSLAAAPATRGSHCEAFAAGARLASLGSSEERRSPTPTPGTFGFGLGLGLGLGARLHEAAETESLANTALTARTLDTAVLLDQDTEQLMHTLAHKKREPCTSRVLRTLTMLQNTYDKYLLH